MDRRTMDHLPDMKKTAVAAGAWLRKRLRHRLKLRKDQPRQEERPPPLALLKGLHGRAAHIGVVPRGANAQPLTVYMGLDRRF